jgi:uncharacterized membrane protein
VTRNATPPEWLTQRRRYRRLSFGVLLAGIVGIVLADAVGYPVVGVGLYWAGFVGFFAVRRWAPVELFDERDAALERRTSYDTIRIAAVALVVLAPTVATLEKVGSYETPPLLDGAIWGYVALFFLYGLVYLARRYRP